MGDNEQRAIQLMTKAEKKRDSSKTFLGSLFSGTAKREEAIDCFIRAANLFKMDKNWSRAGKAFVNAAALHQEVGTHHDAATNFVDAYNCYKRCDANSKEACNDAVYCLLRAIQIYTDMGRFSIAAKQHQNVAELLEKECVALAMQHYEKAGDYFRGEDSTSSATKCMLKFAQCAAQMEIYEKAIEVYEQIAKSSLDNTLLKSCAKEYMFRAALCHLCVDILNAQHALEKYCSLYPAFADTRECKLVKKLIESLEEQNGDAFTEAVTTCDSLSLHDEWYKMMIGRIKKRINDKPDLL